MRENSLITLTICAILWGESKMTRTHFQQELAAVKDKILVMAALAQESVSSALEAYLLRDELLCKFVKRTERAINAAQREIDEMTFTLFAQEQPMAVDLRFLLAVIKINRDLERIGDLAMNVRRRTREILGIDPVDLAVDFAKMGQVVDRMIRSAIRAFLEGDASLADLIREMDDEVDRMNYQAHDTLLQFIGEKPQYAQQAVAGILVAKSLKRIADHASNIAIVVIFWIRAADVRHELPADLD
jgi:phosphate transport system protein